MKEVVIAILEFCPTVRQHSIIRHAAYWAAMNNNNELFDLLTPTLKDKITALWQLKQDNLSEFTTQFERLTSEEKKAYDNDRFDLLPWNSETISGSFRESYHLAVRNRKKDLESLPGAHFSVIAGYALREADYVCFVSLNEFVPKNTGFLTFSFDDDEFDCMIFQMVTNQINFYDMCRDWLAIHQKGNFENFHYVLSEFVCSPLCGQKAFLQDLIRRNLDGFTSDEAELFLYTPKTDALIFECIIACVTEKIDDPGLKEFKNNSAELSLQTQLNAVSLKPETQFLLDRLFKQFGLNLQCQSLEAKQTSLTSLPDEVLTKILNTFYGKRKKYLRIDEPTVLSKTFYILSSLRRASASNTTPVGNSNEIATLVQQKLDDVLKTEMKHAQEQRRLASERDDLLDIEAKLLKESRCYRWVSRLNKDECKTLERITNLTFNESNIGELRRVTSQSLEARIQRIFHFSSRPSAAAIAGIYRQYLNLPDLKRDAKPETDFEIEVEGQDESIGIPHCVVM